MKYKKFLEKANTFLHRYINGTKGAISLMLALLMTPILTLSVVLVESARYQSIVQLMEEISDLCGLSTLAHYDSYLEQRFGLLAVDQLEDKDIDTIFSEYLDANSDMLGTAVTLKDTTEASGAFALSNDDVLFQQIIEQSEISVLTKTVYDGFDLESLLKTLAKKFEGSVLDDLNKQGEFLSASAKVAESLTKLVDDLKALITASNEMQTAHTEYIAAYGSGASDKFEGNLLAFIEQKKNSTTAATEATEESESDGNQDTSSDKDILGDLKNATNDYSEKAKTLKEKLSTLRDKKDAVKRDLTELKSTVNRYRSAEAATEGKDSYDTQSGEWIMDVVIGVVDRLDEPFLNESKDEVSEVMDLLQQQINDLANLKKNDFASVSTTWTVTDIQTLYGCVSIPQWSFLRPAKSIVEEMQKVINWDTGILTTLKNVVLTLLDIDGVYDLALDSVVDSSSIFQSASPDGMDAAFMMLITDMVDTINNLDENFKNGNNTLIGLVKSLGDVLKCIGEFIAAVVVWLGNFVADVVMLVGMLVSSPAEFYKRLLFCGYCNYNLPNRTNCVTGKSLSGYSYSKVFEMNGGDYSRYGGGGGSLEDGAGAGGNAANAFKGAEQEYVMVGSLSEYENQSTAFFNVYMMRLALNLPAVITNKEWNVAGGWSIVVKILIAIAEPILDTIFLVNGMSEKLIKEKLYITPSGLKDIAQKVNQMALGKSATEAFGNELKQKEEEKKKEEANQGGSGDSGDSTGDAGGSTGDSGGSTGDTGGSTGDSGGSTGDTGGSTGDSGDSTGDTGDSTGDSGDGTGDSGENTGGTGGKNQNSTEKKKQSFFSCTYGDHLYLLMFINYKKEDYVNRMQNLIQMDANLYHTKASNHDFDLAQAYAGVTSTVAYHLNPILKVDALTNGGLFDASITRFSGY